MGFRWIRVLVFLTFAPSLWSQPFLSTNLHQLSLTTVGDKHPLPHASIFPSSLVLVDAKGKQLDRQQFFLAGDTLNWIIPPAPDTYPILVSYRFFQPAFLPEPLVRRSDFFSATAGKPQEKVFNPYEKPSGLLYNQNLDYSGSFARGVNFGNNQDLVLNSNFNLQLSGKLNNEVHILAAISDENLPLQPEGNTQQLREFDKVFIQLSKDHTSLTAGDFDWTRPNAHFINYYKKLEGVSFSHSEKNEQRQLQTRSSLALSRSKFGRNIIPPEEGNQGPYRLSGNLGEQLIIVLAGTEKVWLDGQLLVRGTEADYIIDYNLSEIRFTGKQFITKDRRIVVEFEYTDQNFNRLLYGLDADWKSDQLSLGFHLLGQQDSRQFNQNEQLTSEVGDILRNAGDNPLLAIIPSIDGPNDFNPLRVQYQLIDTTDACGNRDTILLYAPETNTQGYQARFSDLGPGNGNYVLDAGNLANEPVFRWVGPDPLTCQPQGRYEPVVPLIAPEKHQVMALNAEYYLSPRTSIKTEIALSNRDPNRLSPIDDRDDKGLAGRLDLQHQLDLSPTKEGLKLMADFHFENIQATFSPLNPFRDPEFYRNWSLVNNLGTGEIPSEDERLAGLELALKNHESIRATLGLQHFVRGSSYSGLRQNWMLAIAKKNWEFRSSGQLLNSQNDQDNSRFFKPSLDIIRKFPHWNNISLGVLFRREKNSRSQTGDLLQSSFFFDRFEAYLESDPEQDISLRTSFSQRKEYSPLQNDFVANNLATEWQASASIKSFKNIQLEQNFMFRQLDFSEAVNENADESNVLGRTILGLTLGKGFFRSTSTWETGSGQEASREFTYIKVAKGQGTHIWLDSLYNNDGIIQLFEMEPAPFADQGDYIKVAGFSRNFIQVHQTVFNQNIQILPARLNLKRPLLDKIALQSIMLINRRTAEQNWNPFYLALADSNLIAVNASTRHTLFYNRGNPSFDLQVSQNKQLSKFVQPGGAESRQNSEWQARSNLRIASRLNLEIQATTGTRLQNSSLFTGKNYHFRFQNLSPKFNFLPATKLRLSGSWLFQRDKSLLEENDNGATQHQLTLDMALQQSTQTSLLATFKWIQMNLEGNTDNPVAFALLNGLQPGKNLQWRFQFSRLLNKTIQVNLHYDGRKGARGKIIHSGGVRAAAVF